MLFSPRTARVSKGAVFVKVCSQSGVGGALVLRYRFSNRRGSLLLLHLQRSEEQELKSRTWTDA